MLNKGDVLQIYPMYPITIGKDGKEQYTMEKPYTVADSSQSTTIRDIFTPGPDGTPIETIDAAANGLKKLTADKKYMIVLTDGTEFYKNNSPLSSAVSVTELDARFNQYAGNDMTVMYLGIGGKVLMPTKQQSETFVAKKAENSAAVLSTLTEMCNQIFGRDTLPKSHLTGQNMKLDISTKKLIVFVQGENIKNLKVSGPVGKLESTTSTKYSTTGANMRGNDKLVSDTSLQGMMVTYTDCGVGDFKIEYEGKATSTEVYYEPDADLAFVFTDSEGNLVDPKELYEGEYKVSFGMKDAKTGQLISSDLLGEPHYEGCCTINGENKPFTQDGKSGEVPVNLKMDDTFEADLTVTYLSGYTITKDSTDFGWPKGGIKVAPRPAGDLKLKISGGDSSYSLQDLEKGKAFTAEVLYQGNKLTGKELEKVKLTWDDNTTFAKIEPKFADDHFDLKLLFKDPKAPANTVCGKCQVSVNATYAAQGSEPSNAKATLTYTIKDDFAPVAIDLFAKDDYIVISDIEQSEAIVATLTMGGKPLSEEDFKNLKLVVDCGGIEHKLTPEPQQSRYLIKLMPTKGLSEKDYTIKATATYTDHIGRQTQSEGSTSVTLSNTPLWLKWLIGILLLLLIIFLIWKILHIRVLPKRVRQIKENCLASLGGKDVTDGCEFTAKRVGKQISIKTGYSGDYIGINVNNIKPGKESYLYLPQHKRSILVTPDQVKTSFGEVTYIDINGVTYIYDKKEEKLVPEDPQQPAFLIKNDFAITYEGNMLINGKTKKFHSEIPITFKK